jgi:hypothetical protein
MPNKGRADVKAKITFSHDDKVSPNKGTIFADLVER